MLFFKSKKEKMRKVIEEIHNSFNTEVDKLLEQAKIKKSTDFINSDDVKYGQILKKNGFINSKEAVLSDDLISKLYLIKLENHVKDELIQAINYFSIKYPFYKFITEESVLKICEKYNLIYGDVELYKENVPVKNIMDIDKFKISDEDRVYTKTLMLTPDVMAWSFLDSFEIDKITQPEFISQETFIRERAERFKYALRNEPELIKRQLKFQKGNYEYQKLNFQIVAPIKYFNTKEVNVNKFKIRKILKNIQIEDPVVLMPVFYKTNKYYLVVTMWGDENLKNPHEEPLLFNQKNN